MAQKPRNIRIYSVADNSKMERIPLGSRVGFHFLGEANFPNNGGEQGFTNSLLVDFNTSRFILSGSPKKVKWEPCSIVGNPNKDRKIEIIPENIAFDCSIVVSGLSPSKYRTCYYDPYQPTNGIVYFNYNGTTLGPNEAFLKVLEYQYLHGSLDGDNLELFRQLFPIMDL